jgi:hypothetical protein
MSNEPNKPNNPTTVVNPFQGATLNAQQLAEAAAKTPAATSTVEDTKSNIEEAKAGGKSYQFPSAPTTWEFQKGRRVTVADGVLTVTDPEEIRQLELAVAAGNIYPYTGTVFLPQQVVPAPVAANKVN